MPLPLICQLESATDFPMFFTCWIKGLIASDPTFMCAAQQVPRWPRSFWSATCAGCRSSVQERSSLRRSFRLLPPFAASPDSKHQTCWWPTKGYPASFRHVPRLEVLAQPGWRHHFFPIPCCVRKSVFQNSNTQTWQQQTSGLQASFPISPLRSVRDLPWHPSRLSFMGGVGTNKLVSAQPAHSTQHQRQHPATAPCLHHQHQHHSQHPQPAQPTPSLTHSPTHPLTQTGRQAQAWSEATSRGRNDQKKRAERLECSQCVRAVEDLGRLVRGHAALSGQAKQHLYKGVAGALLEARSMRTHVCSMRGRTSRTFGLVVGGGWLAVGGGWLVVGAWLVG